jgi:hypothetical protein
MASFLVRAFGLVWSPTNPFTDTSGSVHEADIAALAAAGVTRGCNPPLNDRFCPNASVTRGQMAAFLVRSLALTGSTDGSIFADDDGLVFEHEIELLAAAGITKGCNPPLNSRFCPNAPVRRGELAAFLHRAIGDG